MSYGPTYQCRYRGAARYVDQILNGEKLLDLPVQKPLRLHLTINLKTAKTLGIATLIHLLARADEVIEYGQRNSRCICSRSKFASSMQVLERSMGLVLRER